jgi:hypothetical protein
MSGGGLSHHPDNVNVTSSASVPLVSPMQRRRQRLASVSRASKAIKAKKEASFARTADDKIYSERLEDLSSFVPSFMLDIEQNPLHPALIKSVRENNLPGRVSSQSNTTSHASTNDMVAWQQQQQNTWSAPTDVGSESIPCYPPSRWSLQEGDIVAGDNSAAAAAAAAPNILGSRGLWQRRVPPVRYHARGRVGRNERIFLDRRVEIDVHSDGSDEVNDSHMLHQRHGGRSGRATGAREAKHAREIKSTVMERKYAYGLLNRRPTASTSSAIPDEVPTHTMWSSRRRKKKKSQVEGVVPGTASGARRHIYATPHPLDSGQKFFDIARPLSEQIPTLTSTLKHLIPTVFVACEDIASTQPIISAASSAAGTAKSEYSFFFGSLLCFFFF